ncbi:hypothetical protein [Acetobacterium wieringae]|nr:hypothetical protein [Acetobacterium wieringae]
MPQLAATVMIKNGTEGYFLTDIENVGTATITAFNLAMGEKRLVVSDI